MKPTLQVIADDLVDYEKCVASLNSRDLIIEQLEKRPAELEFWQEPSFVVGGIVVGFAVGSIVALAFSK